MGILQQRIADLITKAGPPTKAELVFTGTPGSAEYEELGTFTFRRLPFSEMDALRLHSLNDKGQFDPSRHAGNNARIVASTLVDDETGLPVYSADDINLWPTFMVDAFATASNKANSNTITAAKEVEKNSVATGGVAP